MRPGSSPPAVVEIRTTPTTLSPKSSGCSSASEIERHAAHRVAHDHAAPGDRVLDDAAQVVAELVDRAVVLVGACRAAVAALVVEHGADLAAVGRALEVPAVEVEASSRGRRPRSGRRRSTARPPKSAGSSISTCRSSASSATTTRRALCSSPNATCSPASRRPMIRLWRTMPAAPAAAARPAAPTTVPKIRPLMLMACLPLCRRRCRCDAARTAHRCGSRSRS